MEKPFLAVRNLGVVLEGQRIVEDISFEVYPGDIISVIGPNGSGKTTLLKTIAGIIKPTEGAVEVSPNIKIGYLPQRFSVDRYLPMTVFEFLKLKPGLDRKQIQESIGKINLSEGFLKKSLASLSAGQIQIALFLWVMADSPQLVLFDEPTENIDITGQELIYNLLHQPEKESKFAIILVSHDLNVVYKYTKKVICLNQKMLCYGAPSETLNTKSLQDLYGHRSFFEHRHNFEDFSGEHHHHHY